MSSPWSYSSRSMSFRSALTTARKACRPEKRISVSPHGHRHDRTCVDTTKKDNNVHSANIQRKRVVTTPIHSNCDIMTLYAVVSRSNRQASNLPPHNFPLSTLTPTPSRSLQRTAPCLNNQASSNNSDSSSSASSSNNKNHQIHHRRTKR